MKKICAKLGLKFLSVPFIILEQLSFFVGILHYRLNIAYLYDIIQRYTNGALTGQISQITPVGIQVLKTQMNYKWDVAKRDIGYEPLFSQDEAVDICATFVKKVVTSQ
jgi:hypothetical protein